MSKKVEYTTLRLTKDFVKELKVKAIMEETTIEDILKEALSK
jgi:hypothetical protein